MFPGETSSQKHLVFPNEKKKTPQLSQNGNEVTTEADA